jgi:Protein of unknown function (DUF3105)
VQAPWIARHVVYAYGMLRFASPFPSIASAFSFGSVLIALLGSAALGGCTAVVVDADDTPTDEPGDDDDAGNGDDRSNSDAGDEGSGPPGDEGETDSGAPTGTDPVDAATPGSTDGGSEGTEPEDTLGQDAGDAPVTPPADAGEPVVADGCSKVTELENEGADHVELGSEIEYGHNPPASGAHYPIWAQYQPYDEVVPRGYWVHNLEHGAVVFLYGPNASEEQQEQLRAVYDALPNDEFCGTQRALLTEDPLLDDRIAVVAWNWVLEASCVDTDAIIDFVVARRGRGPEGVCNGGTFVP